MNGSRGWGGNEGKIIRRGRRKDRGAGGKTAEGLEKVERGRKRGEGGKEEGESEEGETVREKTRGVEG